jgi:hypothetical protein
MRGGLSQYVDKNARGETQGGKETSCDPLVGGNLTVKELDTLKEGLDVGVMFIGVTRENRREAHRSVFL